jgi:hypothetical protein
MSPPSKLQDIAAVVRSKNADPFITTCDIFVREKADYDALKSADVLRPELIASAYGITADEVLGVFYVDEICAVKVSLLKSSRGAHTASGDLEVADLLGAQQHVPLLSLPIGQPSAPETSPT